MSSKLTKTILSVGLFMAVTPASYAYHGSFYLPEWFIALVIAVILLLATPLLWSLALLLGRVFGTAGGARARKLLRWGAGFSFFYAVIYLFSSNAMVSWSMLRLDDMLLVMSPFFALLGLGFVFGHCGRELKEEVDVDEVNPPDDTVQRV